MILLKMIFPMKVCMICCVKVGLDYSPHLAFLFKFGRYRFEFLPLWGPTECGHLSLFSTVMLPTG